MSIGKRLPALVLAVLLLCTVGVTAAAQNVPDLSRKGLHYRHHAPGRDGGFRRLPHLVPGG